MDIAQTVKVLLRRWFVVLVGLAATGVTGAYVLGHVGTDYQASARMVLLLPPDVNGSGWPVNPYLNLDAGLDTVASLAAADTMSKDTAVSLAGHGFSAEYDVALNPDTGPLLVITTRSKVPAEAVATRDAVLAHLSTYLTQLQQGFPVQARQIIGTQVSGASPNAEVLPGSRLRALLGTLGAGGLLTGLGAFVSERLWGAAEAARERRRRREVPRAAQGVTPVDGAEPAAERVLVGAVDR